MYVWSLHIARVSVDQPGKVANPARGQLTGKMNISLSAFAPENLVSRDGFDSPVPRQPAHLHTQAESGAYIRDSSQFPQRRPLLYLKRPDAIESVPSLLDHAIAYRWRSLPRVRRHRASKPLGSSEHECCLFAGHHVPINIPLFPTPTIGMKWACCTSLPRLHMQGLFIFICFALLHVHPCPCNVRMSAEYLYSSENALW